MRRSTHRLPQVIATSCSGACKLQTKLLVNLSTSQRLVHFDLAKSLQLAPAHSTCWLWHLCLLVNLQVLIAGLQYYPLLGRGQRFPINDPNLLPHMLPRPGECALHTLKALPRPGGHYSLKVASVCHISYVDLGDAMQHHLAEPAMIPACHHRSFNSLVCLLRTRSFHSGLHASWP